MRSTRRITSTRGGKGQARSASTSFPRARSAKPTTAPLANATVVAIAAPATPSAGRPRRPKMSTYASSTLTTPTTSPIRSGVRVSPAPRRLAIITKRAAPAGTPSITMRRKDTPTGTTSGWTWNAPTSAGAHARTGTTAGSDRAIAARIDWPRVSSAPRRSLPPTWRATIASVPVPTANMTESTPPRICTPTPTPATERGPRRPTMSMSQSPTKDSIENEKITGQASVHVACWRSRADPAAPAEASTVPAEAECVLVATGAVVATTLRAVKAQHFHAHRSSWRALPEVRAAVDVEDVARDEARVVAGEKDRDGRDVALGIAEAADGSRGHRPREPFGIPRGVVLSALGPGAGGDRVGGDPLPPPLARRRAREGGDGGLGSGIVSEPGVAPVHGEGNEVDDPPAAVRRHVGPGGTHRPPRRLGARAPREVELFLRDRLEVGARAEAVRVVDEDVDPAEAAHGLLDRAFDVALAADVGYLGEGVAP